MCEDGLEFDGVCSVCRGRWEALGLWKAVLLLSILWKAVFAECAVEGWTVINERWTGINWAWN